MNIYVFRERERITDSFYEVLEGVIEPVLSEHGIMLPQQEFDKTNLIDRRIYFPCTEEIVMMLTLMIPGEFMIRQVLPVK